jgi:hypothetical protein
MHDDCVVYIKKVTRVKEILDGKWKLQILCAMRSGVSAEGMRPAKAASTWERIVAAVDMAKHVRLMFA